MIKANSKEGEVTVISDSISKDIFKDNDIR